MAQQVNAPGFGVLTVPGSYAIYNVQQAAAGLAANGILMLVGEATAGPDYTLEANLQNNSFGPLQLGAVIAKYQSGPLVQLFQALCAPSDDPQVPGAPTSFILAKTNPSGQATGLLTDWSTSTYATLGALIRGAAANATSYQVLQATAEVVPTTGAFMWALPWGTVNYNIRVSGIAAESSGTLSAGTTPAQFVTDINGLSFLTATGGVSTLPLGSTTGTLTLAVGSGKAVTITLAGATFTNALAAGDTLFIPATAGLATVIDSGNTANSGSYIVTAATAAGGTVIQAVKVLDATATPGSAAGSNTQPVSVSTTTIVATSDLQHWSAVTVAHVAANPVDGHGKSLEIAALTTGTDVLTNLAWTQAAGTASKVTWISTSASPQLLVSASEYSSDLVVTNVVTAATESLISGGEIALQLGYEGTTATVTISSTSVVLTWTGGSNPALTLTIPFKNFPSIAAVASFINAQTGWSAQAGTGILGLLPATALDEDTFSCATTWGAQTGRLKVDAYRFETRAIGQSAQVQLNTPLPLTGSPAPMAAPLFLSGGTQGGSADVNITGAMDALQNVKGNFLIPAFSQNATADITAGGTDPSSTYDIATINAYAKTHVLLMSQPKNKKNRQALLSNRGTFAAAQAAASNLASFRCCMAFQDVQNASNTGTFQYQPWMLAGLAAAMQASGLYKGIVQKYLNCDAVIQAAGDYNDASIANETTALQAGLLPAKNDTDAGGVYFISDQTTYGSDSNFVYNSLQAVYIADVMALTMAQRCQKAFVGQSIADVSASQAVAYVMNILAGFLTQKLIAPSAGAAKGYQPGSISVTISGTTMTINLTVFLAGLLYFVPVTFQINQVTQTASA